MEEGYDASVDGKYKNNGDGHEDDNDSEEDDPHRMAFFPLEGGGTQASGS